MGHLYHGYVSHNQRVDPMILFNGTTAELYRYLSTPPLENSRRSTEVMGKHR